MHDQADEGPVLPPKSAHRISTDNAQPTLRMFRTAMTVTYPSALDLAIEVPDIWSSAIRLVDHIGEAPLSALRAAAEIALNPHGLSVTWKHGGTWPPHSVGVVGATSYEFTACEMTAALRAALMYAFPDMVDKDISRVLRHLSARLFFQCSGNDFLDTYAIAGRWRWCPVKVIAADNSDQTEVLHLLGMPSAPYLLPLSRITAYVQSMPEPHVYRFAEIIPRSQAAIAADARHTITLEGRAARGLTVEAVCAFMRAIYPQETEVMLTLFATELLNKLDLDVVHREACAGNRVPYRGRI